MLGSESDVVKADQRAELEIKTHPRTRVSA